MQRNHQLLEMRDGFLKKAEKEEEEEHIFVNENKNPRKFLVLRREARVMEYNERIKKDL